MNYRCTLCNRKTPQFAGYRSTADLNALETKDLRENEAKSTSTLLSTLRKLPFVTDTLKLSCKTVRE